jgi:hypothetical protein
MGQKIRWEVNSLKRIFFIVSLFLLVLSIANIADARWYDPQTGKFTSRDPLGEAADSNVYRFVGNNPINWVDPYGLAPHDKFIAQLIKYTDKGIRSAIRNFQRKIAKHEKALTDPKQCLDIKKHEHELRVFREQLKLAEA